MQSEGFDAPGHEVNKQSAFGESMGLGLNTSCSDGAASSNQQQTHSIQSAFWGSMGIDGNTLYSDAASSSKKSAIAVRAEKMGQQ